MRFSVASVAAAALVLGSLGHASADVRRGDRAAELISVKDDRGRRIKLKQYRKKWVVMTFGASWCDPCEKELPAWEKLAKAYKKKGVVFLAINVDSKLAKGKAFMKKAGVRYMRAGYEPKGSTADTYEPPTMPSTFVIDPNGIVRYVHAGYHDGDARKLAKKLDALMKK